MAKTDFKSVDDYIASQPEAVQGLLARVRSTIRKALPGAEEMISYQIPTYKLRGRPVIYFAGWKHHYSLYPATKPLVAALKDELAEYELSKGTIRFPFSKRVPVSLIKRIAKFRAKKSPNEKQLRPSRQRSANGALREVPAGPMGARFFTRLPDPRRLTPTRQSFPICSTWGQ